jgi:hypothetical protein
LLSRLCQPLSTHNARPGVKGLRKSSPTHWSGAHIKSDGTEVEVKVGKDFVVTSVEERPAGGRGHGGPGGRGMHADLAAVAKELGVTEAKLRSAVEAPARPATPSRPSDPQASPEPLELAVGQDPALAQVRQLTERRGAIRGRAGRSGRVGRTDGLLGPPPALTPGDAGEQGIRASGERRVAHRLAEEGHAATVTGSPRSDLDVRLRRPAWIF